MFLLVPMCNDVRDKLKQSSEESKATLCLANSIDILSNCNRDIAHKKKLSMNGLKKHLAECGVSPEHIRLAICSFVRHLTTRDLDSLVKSVNERPLKYFRIKPQPQ